LTASPWAFLRSRHAAGLSCAAHHCH
jgi:hypothetical protein